jgi:WD40 repeat protein/serine/threonine protein kinase/class 3 adenylate cyclase/tetratricopeptide (TPR) repeat protein
MHLPLAMEHRAKAQAFQRKHRTAVLALLFSDLVGSTRLKQDLGDLQAATLLQRHEALFRELLARFPEAEEVDKAGDSFFAIFAKPSDAVTFAVLFQSTMRRLGEGHALALRDRIGIHMGEVVVKADDMSKAKDLYGTQVDTAARVMSLAEGDQILLTRAAFDNARAVLRGTDLEGIGALCWLSHGPYVLKGIEDLLEICEVGEADQAVLKPPPDSEKVRRHVSPDAEPVLGWRPALGQGVPNTQWILERKLGEGTFGEVWLGRHHTLKERRVFKFCFWAERVRSLKREVTLFRLLKERVGRHPNIVAVQDVFLDQPPFYLIMDYAEEKDLRTWCEERGGAQRIPLATRLEIIAQMAEALEAAHEAGVIHRDVKPSNILIGGPTDPRHPAPETVPTARLTDFGTGHVVAIEVLAGMTRLGFTQTNLPSGSAAQIGSHIYLAPELLAGKPASPRSDIYSLGVVLYQLLVGDFKQPVTTDWARRIDDPLLREDLGKCFAGNPQERFAHSGELAAALRALEQRRSERQQIPEPADQPGAVIGRYRILEKIGEGGFGAVYVAEQREPVKRRVALKIIKLGMDTKQVMARFEAERQALALMNHPNIAKVLDAGATETGRPYFVMELVRGIKITDYCDQNHLPTEKRLELFNQVCKAIQHAHQKGIIHRDIKPSNILVALHDGVPVPKVIDFGIAKATERPLTDKTVFTALEQFIGTPAYMSPEQAEMSGLDIDTRSDIYSLGVLLYELLTGRTPFDAKELAEAGLEGIRRMIREKEPVRPSTRLGGLEPAEATTVARRRQVEASKLIHLIRGDLDWIVMKCLEKDRTRRYETANGLAMDISRHLVDEPVTARPPSSFYRFQKLVRRHRTAFMAGSAVFAALLLGVAGSLWQAVRATRAEHEQRHLRVEAQNAEMTAQAEARRADAQAQEVKLTLAAADFSQAIRLIAEDKDHDALAYLCRSLSLNPTNQAAATRLATLLAYRSWELCVCKLQHAGMVSCADFSPDGKLIVTGSWDNTARVWDAQTGQPLTQTLKHADVVTSAKFSPDGNRIVTASTDGTVRVWDVQTGQPLTEPLTHPGPVYSAQFSPNGKWIVTASFDRTARVWDVQTGQPLTEPLKHSGEVYSAQFSPNGKRIVTASKDGTARVWDAESGHPLTDPLKHNGMVISAQFSPDGRWIATASMDNTARVWDVQTGQPLTEPLKHGGEVYSAQFSPNGKWIVTASEDRTARVWDAESGHPLTDPLKHNGMVISAQFSPDGKSIVTVSDDGIARVWDAQSGQPRSEPLKHNARVTSAKFSSDGKRLVTASMDGTARVWEEQSRPSLPQHLRHNAQVASAEFSPDGKRIVTASLDKTAQVWDAQNGQPLIMPLKHDGPLQSAQFSPDGRRIVTASSNGTARVWDAQSGRPLTQPLKHLDAVNSALFSPDGKWIVTASSDNTARVWDANNGEPRTGPLEHPAEVIAAQFSPDSKRIVTMSDVARVWDGQSGKPLAELKPSGPVYSAQFSPDCKQIVTASDDCTARVWDARTGLPLTEPLRHGGRVYSARFSPDGKRIVTASDDSSARVWDAQSGWPLTGPLKHSGGVYSARFSPDGKRIATASNDGTVRVWDVQTGQPLTEPLTHPGPVASAQFSPDGQRVIGASSGNTARVWDISPSASLPPWVLRLAEAFSGEVLAREGFLQDTTLNCAAIVRETRAMLNEPQPESDSWTTWGRWLVADPATREISPFSKVTMEEYVSQLIGDNTEYSLREAQNLAYKNPEVSQEISQARERLDLAKAAELHARAGQWGSAITDFSKLLELQPTNHEVYHSLAPLLVQNSDLEGYRRHCARALAQFKDTHDPTIAERMAKDCLILPNSDADLEAVSQWAETAVTKGKTHEYLPFFQFAKGLTEYRRGRFDSATVLAQKVLASPAYPFRDAEACLLLAMAQQKLNHPDEARAALARGADIIETKLPKLESGDLGEDWGDWIISHALMHEAKALIEKPPGALPDQPNPPKETGKL